jgi:hypothetical protein
MKIKIIATEVAIFLFVNFCLLHASASPQKANEKLNASNGISNSKAPSKEHFETYKDLVNKAQNLTLQHDRLQTSQVLVRAIQGESKDGKSSNSSIAHKELVRVLDELTGVFYTEKAQNLYSAADASSTLRPKESLDGLQEALRIEEGNVTIIKAISRINLVIGECGRADVSLRSAEALNPYSVEIKLLRLQVLDCNKQTELLTAGLTSATNELDNVDKFAKGIFVKDLLFRKEIKKAKQALALWETQFPDYPELYYWKWQLGQQTGIKDRTSALRYSQLCQNLTNRKRKSFALDVDLCKGKEAADLFLQGSGIVPSAPSGVEPHE